MLWELNVMLSTFGKRARLEKKETTLSSTSNEEMLRPEG
jgi:hypothetical protein